MTMLLNNLELNGRNSWMTPTEQSRRDAIVWLIQMAVALAAFSTLIYFYPGEW